MVEAAFLPPTLPPTLALKAAPHSPSFLWAGGLAPMASQASPWSTTCPSRPETSCSARDLCKRAGVVMSPQGDYLPAAGLR